MINPGLLRHKILIQQLSISQDSELNITENWIDIKTLWSNPMSKGGREFYRLQNMNSEITEVFQIRFCKIDVRNRIYFKCKQFEIIDIINVNERNMEILITCKAII